MASAFCPCVCLRARALLHLAAAQDLNMPLKDRLLKQRVSDVVQSLRGIPQLHLGDL